MVGVHVCVPVSMTESGVVLLGVLLEEGVVLDSISVMAFGLGDAVGMACPPRQETIRRKTNAITRKWRIIR
jgi:hypothetical protein